jgi:hypothetical protein
LNLLLFLNFELIEGVCGRRATKDPSGEYCPLFSPRIAIEVESMVSASRIRPVEIVRGIYLGELTLRASFAQLSKSSITISSSVIAFILSIPTLVFLAEFAQNHSLQGRALVFKNLGFVVGPLSLAVLPAMSNLFQSLLAISGLIHYFIRRIIHWRVVEKSLSVVSEISIIGEGSFNV